MSDASAPLCEITLPEGYKLLCWKVGNGSSVRVGETIALAVPKGAEQDDVAAASASTTGTSAAAATTTSAATSQLHKRPSRRRRPVATGVGAVVPVSTVETTTGNDKHMSSSVTAAFTSKLLAAAAASGASTAGAPATSYSISKQDSQQAVAVIAKVDGIVRTGLLLTPDSFHREPKQNQQPNGEIVVIGYITACQHPTIIEGLCAICGTKTDCNNGKTSGDSCATSILSTTTGRLMNSNNDATAEAVTSTNGSSTMSRMTVSGLTVSVSQAEGKRMAQQDAQRLQKLRKLSLVLDLDHTLVHATADPRAQIHSSRDDVRSLVLPVMMALDPFAAAQQLHHHQQQQQWPPPPPQQQVWLQRHFVKLRPHVKEFLESAMEDYEIGVYTAGTREYAEQITILLARHLVGAPRDQVELEHLRQHVAHVEREYQREQQQQQQQHDNNNNNAPALNNSNDSGHSSNNTTTGQKDDTETEQLATLVDTVNGDGAEKVKGTEPEVADKVFPEAANGDEEKNQETGKKRKRVTFGEVPSSVSTDQISRDQVDGLRAELEEAERFERQALDFRQKLFGSRVVSRTEVGDLGRDVKSLKRIFPCGGSMAAVIDDREDVWANAEDVKSTRRGEPPENLLLVRPYHWTSFLGFADVNNASGADFMGQDSIVESESDEQLLWTADVLKRLHYRYFSYDDGPDRPTVPDILEKMRREVLSGCNLVLSGLVPLHKQSLDPNRPRPPVIRYAENLGSTVLPSVTKSVTHVVAAKDGTDKILTARRIKGCHIVKASWLIECVWSLTHRDETRHLLLAAPLASSTSANGGALYRAEDTTNSVEPLAESKSENTSSSSSEDDDDSFVADLQNELMRDAGEASK